MRRCYTQPHRFYAGVDLHARTIALHVRAADGRTARAKTLAATPAACLDAGAPCRDGRVGGCACRCAWYGLADLGAAESIPFVLGHALYRKAIPGGKSQTDQIDAAKLARLLRGGACPHASV